MATEPFGCPVGKQTRGGAAMAADAASGVLDFFLQRYNNDIVAGFLWSEPSQQDMARVLACSSGKIRVPITFSGDAVFPEMDGKGYSLDASTLSLLIDQTAAGSLNRSILKLIGRLVPKELMETPA
ncbi:hypothetical protein L1987_73311 [Smallanthus sonchifolius]|uniref:Uncharacterized protein n=1 Tax=Smallanthus sonchifolius TaxID=185202 RepID=A0ACB9A132_9ASTR|nr:hypothetical protein L1987_73311 [Smallanthus sonchifolius]